MDAMQGQLTFLTGRASSMLWQHVYTQMGQAMHNGHPVYLVVPEQNTLKSELRLVEYLQLSGLFHCEVLSLRRMSQRVFSYVGGAPKRTLSTMGRTMAMKLALWSLPEDSLSVYAKSRMKSGFAEKLALQISDFKRLGIGPEDAQMLLERAGPALLPKVQDLFTAYKAYQEILGDTWADGDDVTARFIENLPKAAFLQGAHVFVEGFESLSPQVHAAVLAMLQVCASVTIALLHDDGRDQHMFLATRNAMGRLKQAAHAQGAHVSTIYAPTERTQCASIAFLEKELFAYPHQTYHAQVEGISLCACVSPYEEAARIAAQVMSCVRDMGLRYRDISILCGDSQTYAPLLSRALQRHDIPSFAGVRMRVSTHPIIRYLQSALSCAIHNYPQQDVFRALGTGFSGLTQQQVFDLENYCLARGVKGYRFKQPFTFGKNAAQMEELHTSFMAPMIAFEERLRNEQTMKHFITSCVMLLEDAQCLVPQEARALRAEQTQQDAQDAQVWKVLMQCFDQLADLVPGDIPTRQAATLLEEGLLSANIALLPPAPDEVEIGPLGHVPDHAKVLFVCGLGDGIFGADPPALLLEDEKAQLSQNGLYLGPSAQEKQQLKRLDTYLALSCPQEALFLSYSLASLDGTPSRPAQVLATIRTLFPTLHEEGGLLAQEDQHHTLLQDAKGSFAPMAAMARKQRDGDEIPLVWQQAHAWYKTQDAWQEELSRLEMALTYGITAPPLPPSLARSLYDARRTSISQLETFAKCPFAHFTRYGLRPRERKLWEVLPMDVGNFYHQVLENFSKEVSAHGIEYQTLDNLAMDELLQTAAQPVLEEVQTTALGDAPRMKALQRHYIDRAYRAIKALCAQLADSHFLPMDAEITFGEGGSAPALPIVLADGTTVGLSGRIDRVDLLKGDISALRVIDYKKSAQTLSLTQVYWGLSLQLLIYLQAALSAVDPQGEMLPAGAFYFCVEIPTLRPESLEESVAAKEELNKHRLRGLMLRDHTSDSEHTAKGDAVSLEEMHALMAHATQTAKRLLQEAMDGQIELSPVISNREIACKRCEYAGICRFDRRLSGCAPRKTDEPKIELSDFMRPMNEKEEP